jgi:hypothetical protein
MSYLDPIEQFVNEHLERAECHPEEQQASAVRRDVHATRARGKANPRASSFLFLVNTMGLPSLRSDS